MDTTASAQHQSLYERNKGGGESMSSHQISTELLSSQFITHRKPYQTTGGTAQRKNTSDSNVKLLADHNFYHVTNNVQRTAHHRYQQHINESLNSLDQQQQQYSCNDGLTSNGCQTTKFKDMAKMAQRSYELSDYFKYNAKFRQRGLNSSSNSLISLNSSR